jgi:hypothetical protein
MKKMVLLPVSALCFLIATVTAADEFKVDHGYSTNLTIWPNTVSYANSDPWLAKHHDELREMHPRVLAINFVNGQSYSQLVAHTEKMIWALAESSKYHGYKNTNAPAFLKYKVFKYIDLSDPGAPPSNCTRTPVKANTNIFHNFDHNGLYSEQYAGCWGVRDPRDMSRYLRLDELVDLGYIHEVWTFTHYDNKLNVFETNEIKPVYDDNFQKISNLYKHCGNGADQDLEWYGRSLRFNGINWTRGVGCGMENLAHSIEAMAHSEVIPYYTKYFDEFAGFDLDKRYGLPFDSLYWMSYDGKSSNVYPNPTTVIINCKKFGRFVISNYVAKGGNCHFPPNGRWQYDKNNTQEVMSTIEDWRIGSGPDGKDLAKPWSIENFRMYWEKAPDCMGTWIIYWRQNMPGLDNKAKDDDGKPMKNWWPFLFY